MALRPSGAVDQGFYDALDAQLRQMPHFFDNAPFVLDLEHAQGLDSEAAMVELVEALRRRRIRVFGVQNAAPPQLAAAERAGLIPMPAGREAPAEDVAEKARRAVRAVRGEAAVAAAVAEAAVPAPRIAGRLVTESVRSGQKIVADAGDLVVVGSVSPGAELIAAGSIHVYGALRGRAMAGVNGDRTARIFCQRLDADLLAIAGLYLTSEDIGPDMRNQPVQAFLRDDTLCIEAIR